MDPNLVTVIDTVPVSGTIAERGCCGMSGIAYNSLDDTLLVVDSADRRVVELNRDGTPTGRTLRVPRPDVPDDPLNPFPGRYSAVGLAFDPGGDGGRGSVYLTVSAWQLAILYEIALRDELLRSFPPAEEAERFLGLPGTNFSLTGGIDLIEEDGALVGVVLGNRQLPAGNREATTRLFEVRVESASPSPPTFLECRQERADDDVTIVFHNNGPYDAVHVFRDCQQIAALGGSSESFRDAGVAPGLHEYEVRGVVDGVPSGAARCEVRVGLGAILEMVTSHPLPVPTEIQRDPEDGTF